MPEKKASHRRKPVVEEVTPEPVQVEQPVPVVEQAAPGPKTILDPTPEEQEEKAKLAISELDSAQKELKKGRRSISFKIVFILTVLIALVVGFIAGGVYVYSGGTNPLAGVIAPTPSPSPSPTPEPTPAPTPTPEPVDVSEFTISVLNGSGKIGEAGTVENLLEGAGFTVGNTGNASRYDYTDTVIQAMDDVPDSVIDQLEEALSDDYSIEIGDNLPSSSTFDIVVTVGSK